MFFCVMLGVCLVSEFVYVSFCLLRVGVVVVFCGVGCCFDSLSG